MNEFCFILRLILKVVYVHLYLSNIGLFWLISLIIVGAPFAQTLRSSIGEGRPVAAVVGDWVWSVQCVARSVRSIFFFFSTGVDKTTSQIFSARRFFFVLCFFKCWRFWLIRTRYLFENDTAGNLWKGRFRVYYHPSLGARRTLCRVSRVHAPRVSRHIFSLKQEKKTGHRSNIAWIQLTTLILGRKFKPRQAFHVCFFSFVFLFSFFVISFFCSCFLLEYYTSKYVCTGISLELHCSPQLCRPCTGRFEVYYHRSLGTCVMCHAWCFVFCEQEKEQSAWSNS